MISSHDRSGWFGASDTKYIVGNWNTKTFDKWWMIKLGLTSDTFQSQYMMAGTHYEHKILDSLNINIEKDEQIILPELLLRVNLDGRSKFKIFEVKTHKSEKFKAKPEYLNQVQVQMFATGCRNAEIVSYRLMPEDYSNFFNEIDERRISRMKVTYDSDFINDIYMPRLIYLKDYLKKGMFPGVVCSVSGSNL